MTALAMTERDFQSQVLDLAHLRGWESFHPRPARTLDSWRTAGTGSMARGWPDLVLVRERDQRLMFVELKRDSGRLSADQERVLSVLRSITHVPGGMSEECACAEAPQVEVVVWRPADWDAIERALA